MTHCTYTLQVLQLKNCRQALCTTCLTIYSTKTLLFLQNVHQYFFLKDCIQIRSTEKCDNNLLYFIMCLNCSITASVIAGLKKSFHSVLRYCVELTKCTSSCRQSLSSEQCRILIGVVISTLSSNSCD